MKVIILNEVKSIHKGLLFRVTRKFRIPVLNWTWVKHSGRLKVYIQEDRVELLSNHKNRLIGEQLREAGYHKTGRQLGKNVLVV